MVEGPKKPDFASLIYFGSNYYLIKLLVIGSHGFNWFLSLGQMSGWIGKLI